MIESEERWVFYDDEETEVLVETSNYIYNMLLREAMGDLMRVKSIRENLGEVQNQDGSEYLDEWWLMLSLIKWWSYDKKKTWSFFN